MSQLECLTIILGEWKQNILCIIVPRACRHFLVGTFIRPLKFSLSMSTYPDIFLLLLTSVCVCTTGSLGLTAPSEGAHSRQSNASAVLPSSHSNQDQPHSISLPSPTQAATCTSVSPSASSSANQGLNPINPSHLQLVKWKDRQGQTQRFYLMDVIGNKWRSVGHQLGLLPSQLEGIASQFGNNATECCRAVLGEWLENPPSDYPVTWEGLMELLEDCKLTQVAVKLKSALTEAKLL